MEIKRNSNMYFFAAVFLLAAAAIMFFTETDARIAVTIALAGCAFFVIALKKRREEKNKL